MFRELSSKFRNQSTFRIVHVKCGVRNSKERNFERSHLSILGFMWKIRRPSWEVSSIHNPRRILFVFKRHFLEAALQIFIWRICSVVPPPIVDPNRCKGPEKGCSLFYCDWYGGLLILEVRDILWNLSFVFNLINLVCLYLGHLVSFLFVFNVSRWFLWFGQQV